MDLYGYSGVFLVKRFLDNPSFEDSNMTDINKANPQGCDYATLGDRFIQGFVIIFAFSTLMLKRLGEPARIRRPWRIWFFDTSKQAIGVLFINFANFFLSTLAKEDPCSLSMMNYLLDATLGMLVIWLAVKLVSRLVKYKEWTLLMFGEYGDPPRAAAWLSQCGVYLLFVALEKSVVILVMLIRGWSRWQGGMLRYFVKPQRELVAQVVMPMVSLIANTVMFWVMDSLMMRKNKTLEASEKANSPPWNNCDESRGLLTVESETEEASEAVEGDDDADDATPVPTMVYSGGSLRPSWVMV
ncbi:unnamed protein product [Ophioblennius macclurei]